MALFVVSYDLNKDPKHYQKLWDALEKIGAHRALESFWLLKASNKTTADVFNLLHLAIDSDDGLMVVEFVGKPPFTNAREGTDDWIKNNC